MSNFYWNCKDGRRLKLSELETDHLKNIIAMLRRKGAVTPDEFASMAAYRGGEMAEYAVEQEMMNSTPSATLGLLEEELTRRTA